MYEPRFAINHSILNSIGLIEASKEVVDNAPLVPDFEKQFQSDAIIRSVHHGTHIEGNDLTLDQTRQVLEGQSIYARERDIQEVINYRSVVNLLDVESKKEEYDLKSLLKIHETVVDKIIPIEKIGLRKTQVVIKEEGTGKVIFTPPSPIEVPYQLNDFFNWFNSENTKIIHTILRAGIAHYILVSIHPFVEGNGRTARAFTNLVLLKEGYDTRRLFAIEEHFDNDPGAYYEAFYMVDSQSINIAERDLTPWLDYFCKTVAIELVKVKEKVKKLSIDSRLKIKIGHQIALSARQMKIIEYLSENKEAGMRDLKDVLTMVSEDTILRDLKDLQKKGIIDKEGSTKAAKYVLTN